MAPEPTEQLVGDDGEASAMLGPALRRRWRIAVATGVAALAVGTTAVADVVGAATGWRWAVGAAVVVGFVLATFRYHLPRNHPPEAPEKRRQSVGAANSVTLCRGGLIAAVAGFLLVEPSGSLAWIPATCYGIAAALDWVDGRLAHATDGDTVLGARLDMAVDTTGLLIAAIVGVRWGPIPAWYLLMPAARYAYRGAVGLRERRGRPVDDLPESRLRRPVAGLQMAFVAVALVPVTPTGVVRPIAAIAVTVGLAVFVRDFLSVTRRLPDTKT